MRKFNCYDCIWATDKCKNTDSDQYNKFLNNISKCSCVGVVDNTIGCSWNQLDEDGIKKRGVIYGYKRSQKFL